MSAADEVRRAARRWRDRQAGADRARDELRAVVAAAVAAGVSEVQVAQAAGVARTTVRAWLGKGGY